MKKINPLGFLGLVGLVGVAGFFSESTTLFFYFTYLGYFHYFSVPYTQKQRDMTLSALALAYVISFSVNMVFVALNGITGSINYESGFYTAYSAGSFAFPVVFTALKIRESWKKRKAAA